MFFIEWLKAGDTWLIERIFEPLAWRIEYYTGKNNFWCSRLTLVLWPAAFIGTIGALGWSGWHIFSVGAVLLVASVSYWRSVVAEANSRFSVASMERLLNWPVRLGWFCLVLLPPIWKLSSLGALGYVTHMYFLACNQPPPSWKEARDKARQARMALKAHTA